MDIVDALDLLDSCVRDRGADYRPRRRHGSAGSPTGRIYQCAAATDSIVDLALIKGGVPHAGAGRLARRLVADPYPPGPDPFNLTLGAAVVLRAAGSAERLGKTWRSCLQAGLQAAATFVELIPDSVVECAAEIPGSR
jgi:hypothetical protein